MRHEMQYESDRRAGLLLVPLLVGSAVAVALGVYGRVHSPSGVAVNVAGFSGPLEAKVWLTTGALAFGLVQLASAVVMYGRLPGVRAPAWIGTAHRWSGRVAFLLAVPVAIHCLYAVGLQTATPRVFAHSLLGCLFFGAFVVKLLGLRRPGLPGWGPAGARRAGVHAAGRPVVDLGAVVLRHVRRAVLVRGWLS